MAYAVLADMISLLQVIQTERIGKMRIQILPDLGKIRRAFVFRCFKLPCINEQVGQDSMQESGVGKFIMQICIRTAAGSCR